MYLVIEHLPGERPSTPIATNTPLHSQSEASLSLPHVTHFLRNKISRTSLASQATAISSSTASSTNPSQKTHEAQDIVSFLRSMKRAPDDKECNGLFLRCSSSSAPTSSSSSAPASSSSSAPASSSASASSSRELHLYSLIIIATTIHRHHVRYKVLSENCYFLVGSIFHLVEKMYRSARIDSETSSGSWHSVQLFLPKGDIFDPECLQEEIINNLSSFENLVSSWALAMINITDFGLQIVGLEMQHEAKDQRLHELEEENSRLKQEIEKGE